MLVSGEKQNKKFRAPIVFLKPEFYVRNFVRTKKTTKNLSNFPCTNYGKLTLKIPEKFFEQYNKLYFPKNIFPEITINYRNRKKYFILRNVPYNVLYCTFCTVRFEITLKKN